MFEYPFGALLDHAWCDTELPAIRISSRKSHATFCDKVPEIHSHFVICCDNFAWGLCLFEEQSLSCEMTQQFVFSGAAPFL